ncbi:Protein scarlet [Chionoecetes opilio]|uniref:Protein scarlet n=1 Tax=Chionoecetes opilio TaxID=41210 RepID=A0A8J4Y7C1_CHIOP|nr:Protein scarlet [Chionoecetes opilio]
MNLSSLLLKLPIDSALTTCLLSPCQSFTTLFVNQFFPISFLNLRPSNHIFLCSYVSQPLVASLFPSSPPPGWVTSVLPPSTPRTSTSTRSPYSLATNCAPGKGFQEVCDNFAVSAYAKDVELIIQYQDNRFLQFADQKSYDGSYSPATSDTASTGSTQGLHRTNHQADSQLPGWWTQMYWLWWRAVLDSYRNPAVHGIRILQKIVRVMAFLIGVCYSGVEISQRGIQDIEGVLFIYITENTFPSGSVDLFIELSNN